MPFHTTLDYNGKSTGLFRVTICVQSFGNSTSALLCSTFIATLFHHHFETILAPLQSLCVRRKLYFSTVSYQKRVGGYFSICIGTSWYATTLHRRYQLATYPFAQVSLRHWQTKAVTDQITIDSFIGATSLCTQLSLNSIRCNRMWAHHPLTLLLSSLLPQTSIHYHFHIWFSIKIRPRS